MTPLQQACLSKLKAVADANMAFFECYMPEHALLLRSGPQSTMDISEQGDLVVRFPDGSTKSLAVNIMEMEKRLQAFEDLNDRPQILAYHNLRQYVEEPTHGDLQILHYSQLDAEYPNRARRHFAKFYPDNSGLRPCPFYGEDQIPLLIVFGSGMGWHIPRLLAQYRIRYLVVIETDVEAFRLSVFMQDYIQLSRLAAENNTDLIFIVQSEVEKIARSLMVAMLKSHGLPQFFIHGASLFYAVEDEEEVSEIRGIIMETLWELFFGMGYFDDEVITVRHTFENLRRDYPIFLECNTIKQDAVAFVVGSGPSLDNLIPIIREYGDRAVIFSCGTAISILYKMGIKPDFHVEKERPSVIQDVVIKSVDGDLEWLKGIYFIGLNNVYSGVFDLFADAGMIIKSADTMGAVLSESGFPNDVILSGQPTVTNLAIEYALNVGFNRIFLFGVDMGSKVKEVHHSKSTVYVDMLPEEDDLKKFLLIQPENSIVVPGNFGGDAYTNKILAFSNRMIAYHASIHSQSRIFNLNDGAKIDYVSPLHPEDFLVEWREGLEKSYALKLALEAFRKSTFDHELIMTKLMQSVDGFIAKVEAIVNRDQSSYSDILDKMSEIHALTFSPEHVGDACALLFRGTVARLLSMTYNACGIIRDLDEVLAKAESDFLNLLDFLHAARRELVLNVEVGLDLERSAIGGELL
jgi:hypothetical protein